MKDGFVKVASASPVIKVADCDYNADVVIDTIFEAENLGVKVLVFPELTLTGCSCKDLVAHKVILDGAARALIKVCDATLGTDMLIFVGLPVEAGCRVYSCAAAICSGYLLGIVPRESVDGSPFASPEKDARELNIAGVHSSFLCPDMLFEHAALPALKIGVEIGEDSEKLIPPSLRHASAGATIIARMASFPETVDSDIKAGKDISTMSCRLSCGIVMAAPGRGESSTDNSYSGL